MTSVNYPSPVQVNGYTCRNCTDVDYAKKHIDPQHPKDGPFGINKAPAPGAAHKTGSLDTAAVTFGGQLAALAPTDPGPTTPSATQGQKLDLKV